MKYIIAGATLTVITASLLVPQLARATNEPPADAPYQQSYQDGYEDVSAEPEPVMVTEEPTEEPVPESTSPTLPTTYTAPITPAQPTTPPVSSLQAQSKTAAISSDATVTPLKRPKLLTNLLLTLTARSMRQSRIWSGY